MPEMDWQSKPLSAEWREAESKLWLARRSPAVLESAEASEINLATGSPPFPVHRTVKEAIDARVQKLVHLGYPPANGDEALREAIAEFDREHLGATYEAGDVVITYGAMQALSDVVGSLAAPGDEVLLPTPYWFQFPSIVELNRALPRNITTFPGNNFKLTPKLLQEAITPRSRVLILTNPNNPTGAVYSRDELADLVEILKIHSQLVVVSDEVYNLLFPGTSGHEAAPSLCSFGDIAERVIVVNSFAKNFAMSGLRVGYAASKDAVRRTLITQRQEFTSLGVNLYLQAGALAALRATGEIVGGMINGALVERRKKAGELLAAVPRFRFIPPQAAYYYWVDVSGWFGCRYVDGRGDEKVIRDDRDLSTYLKLKIAGLPPGVSVVNGTGCGMPGYFRLTYAVAEEDFAEGVKRIRQRLDLLQCG
ncbi:MAG TPA: aminotransferase class I/II-fold pyridoxal phosphate-dependent enzyme [Thermoanaerobaculia bacterium]|nr:aminotransferase class I/II-fold pyridoxal phosphate-dependent enzyme [Thermoanaerobaculia bacterium]